MAEKVSITIEVDQSGAVRAFKNAGDAARDFGRAAETASGGIRGLAESGTRIGSAFSGFAGKAVALNQSLDLLGKVAGAAGTALESMFQGINRGADLAELSQKLGVSVEAISSLDIAAQQSGVSMEYLGTSLKIMSRNMVEASSGGAEASAAFKALGVAVTDSSGNLRDQQSVLFDAATAFAGIEAGAGKTALAMKVFGKSGTEILPFLNEGAAGLQRFIELNKALGLTIDTETAAALDSIADNFGILTGVVGGVSQQLAAGMAPALAEISQELLDFAAGLGIGSGGVKEIGAEIGAFIRTQVEPFLQALREMSERAKEIGLAEAFQEQIPEIAAAMAEIGVIVGEKAISAGKDFGAGIAQGIADSVTENASSYEIAGAAIGALVLGGLAASFTRSKVLGFAAASLGAAIGASVGDAFGGTLEQDVEDRINSAFANADPKAGLASLEGALAQTRTIVARGIGGEEAQGALAALEDAYLQLADKATVGADAVRKSGDEFTATAPKLRTVKPGLDEAAKAATDFAAELQKAGAIASVQQSIYAQAASGAISFSRAEQIAAASSEALAKGLTSQGAALAALSVKQAQATAELVKATAAQVDANDASLEQIDILSEAVSTGADYEETLRALAVATIDREAANRLAITQDEAAVEAWRAGQIAALEYGDQVEDLNATLETQRDTTAIEAQIGIWAQVEAGIIDVAEAHKLVAIEALKAKGVSEEAARAQVEANARLADSVERLGKESTVVADAFNEFIAGIASGTQELSLDGIADAFKAAFAASVAEKLKFDDIFEGNMFDLAGTVLDTIGGAFKSVFSGAGDLLGSLFSGGGGSGGGLFSDVIGGGSSTAPGGGIGGFLSGLLGDGSYGKGGTFGPGGALGGGAGGALGGALAGYGVGQFLGVGGTSLNGIAGRGANNALGGWADGANQIGSAIIGAVLGWFLGPAGGALGGAISSAFGSLVMNSIDRDALRNQRLSGPLGNDLVNAFVLPGALGSAMNILMPIPTLGEAFRRGGESMIDASGVFGGTDGTGGLQAMFGDFTRSNAKRGVKGVPDDLLRNFDTGAETAIARGFTQGQADLVTGGAGGLFNFIARKEEFKEDAGRFGLEMGQSMAEFLSRGLAEGMTFDEVFASLRTFADESGVTLMGAIRNLPDLMASVTANALAFSKGSVDATAAAQEGAAAYAQSLMGISAIFQGDFPAGVNVAAIALSTLEKDGVKAFGEITRSTDDWLKLLAESPEEFQKQVSKLAEQGFDIDTAEFEARLADISASATQIGATLGAVFTSDDVESGIDSMIQSLRGVIGETFGTELMSQLFDKTSIATAFEPVFTVLRNIENFDLTTATGVRDFGAYLTAAIAQGRANLEEYKPLLKEIVEVSKEWQEAIEEALAPGPLEALSDAWETLIDAIEADLRSGFASAVRDGINAGFADGEVNFDAGLAAFRESFRQNVYEGVLQGIIEAVAQSVVIDALAPMIAEGKKLWLEALDPNGDGGAGITAAEQARIDSWGTRFKAQTDVLIDSLEPFFASIFGQWGFFLDKTTAAVDARTGEPTYTDVGGPRRGFGRAANGGFFSDAAIVGEAGYPELVQTVPGGFHVTPLSWDQANALMGAGAPGLARGGFGGGATAIGGRSFVPRSPGDSYGGGVGGGRGPVLNPTGNPGDLGGRGGSEDGSEAPGYFNLDFSGLLRDFASGAEDFGIILEDATREHMLAGATSALLSGRLGKVIEGYGNELEHATTMAMRDGVLSVAEAEELRAIGERMRTSIGAEITALGPVFDALRLRIPQAIEEAAPVVRDLLGSALGSVASTDSFAVFSGNLRQGIFEMARGGLVDAFIDSAVVQGLLAGPLGAMQAIFDRIAQKQLSVAEANVLLAEQTAAISGLLDDEAFRASFESVVESIKGMGESLGVVAYEAARIPDVVSPIVQSAQDVVAAGKDVCGARCQLEKETLDYGFAASDNYGRLGQTLVERYVPRFEPPPPPRTREEYAEEYWARRRGESENAAASSEVRALRAEVAGMRADLRAYSERDLVANVDGKAFLRAQVASKQTAGKARARL